MTDKVMVKVKIWNFGDELEAKKGLRDKNEVRTLETEALVDSGATLLTLPEDLIERLGLEILDEAMVSYANGSRKRKKIAGVAVVEVLRRRARVDCVVENRGAKVLLGQIPLEEMDLIIDPKKGSLGPRPESPDVPLIELK